MSKGFDSMTRSVDLDTATRTSRNDRIPLFIAFIPWPYQIGTQGDSGFVTLSGADAQGPDGLQILSGNFIDIILKIPRDMPFRLESFRFTAWNPAVTDRGDNSIGSRSILAQPATLYSGSGTSSVFTAQAGQNIIYTSYLAASVYLGSAGSRDQYGGMEIHPQTRETVEVPLQVQSAQSDMNGPTVMKVRALLGQNTTVTLRIRNNYTGTLRVNGCAFGYKIPAA